MVAMETSRVVLVHSRFSAAIASYASLPLTFLFAAGFLWAAIDPRFAPSQASSFGEIPRWVYSVGYLFVASIGTWFAWLGATSCHGWWAHYTIDEAGVHVATRPKPEAFVPWSDISHGDAPVPFLTRLYSPNLKRPISLLNDWGWTRYRPEYLAAFAVARRVLGPKLRIGLLSRMALPPN
jgi:hypothetical protein